MLSVKEIKIPLWLSLGLGVLVYCFFYLNHQALPGNSLAYPLGWWGWYDQGEYLKAAQALAQGDFSPSKHSYPPLYPALGSVFASVLPVHPFFFVNAAGVLAFAYVFMMFATRYVSQLEAFLLLAFSVYFNPIIIANFAVPWTTTGTVLIYSFAIYQLLQRSKPGRLVESLPIETAKAFLFSGVFGLMVILRPVDAGAAAVFYPAYLYFSFKSLGGAAKQTRNKILFFQTLALGAGLLIGVGLFLLFNLEVHGQILGGYFKSTATASGYFPLELPRKFFSLVFDANTVFLEPRASLVSHFPWLVLSLLGLVASLIWGSAMLKVMAAAVCLQFCLYAPYGDLLPNGVWRYFNIHYFKWMFPYLAFFGWLVVRWVFESTKTSKLKAVATRTLVVVLAAAVLLMPRFSVAPEAITFKQIDSENRIAFSSNGDAIDFIDFRGLAGGFNEIYMGDHKLMADGKPMHRVKDFRLLPAPWGIRVLFNRTVHAKEFLLTPDKGLNFAPGGLQLTGSTYHFALGKPRLIHDRAPAVH